MANFSAIGTYLEGVINNGLNATRQTQGVWEWYNALQRITSQNRFTGTLKVVGLQAATNASQTVETVAARVFGLLIDNSMTAEDAYLTFANGTNTAGTTNELIIAYAPRNTITTFVYPEGVVFTSGLYGAGSLGTQAGEAAGTASTTQVKYVAVYSV